ncbi:helix-turn-helix domain-containing protein [Roseivivax marinus]|uniref:helix-turn-helix domain-containing protein n=1 Tax=Roseivivax marinus TaxID=1379903 RepID=UPI001F047C8C|nr:helix-turn-helix domain-containing protein [Roseivivax marinus]UMA64405.1 helix-turn-helix domain-containing protein [Roseivivax marinus]
MIRKPFSYETSRLARFLDRRITELAPKKSQREIAIEAGFPNVNYLSMLKKGASKLALDRVPALAHALEVDPRFLFRAALEQHGFETQLAAVEEIFGTIVSENEVGWLKEIRDASGHTDPRLTRRARAAIRAIFGK